MGSNRDLYYKANEFSNLLLVVVSKNNAIENGYTHALSYYNFDVQSYSDYYPFGMQMPERNGGQSDYRYSFNGMEKDDEV